MTLRRLLVLMVLPLVVAGCDRNVSVDEVALDENAPPGAASPEAAVTGLLSALSGERYDEAVDFGLRDQLPVIALAEGADAEQMTGLMTSGDPQVGANFWRAFTEGLQGFVGVSPDQIRIESVVPFQAAGRDFARVTVGFPNDQNIRSFVIQEMNGWRVDVLASFAAGLAGRVESAANVLVTDPENADILAQLAGQRPSLEAALTDPQITPQLDQDIRAALVAISG